MTEKSKNKGRKKETTKRKVMVWLSFHTYIQGVSERLQRVYKKYNIQTAMKPINTLNVNVCMKYHARTVRNPTWARPAELSGID